MGSRMFDLNIEKILENWESYHAVREVIANALDEQQLTGTGDISIYKDTDDIWRIRDFGRGITYEHLTQKENEEKLSHPNLIGKFGIGLKDALATFNRMNIDVKILSKHGDITVSKSRKHNFEDIATLHALIEPPVNSEFVGTEFVLKGLNDDDIDQAKNLFLKFSDSEVIETTKYGSIIEKTTRCGDIFINGVKVAEEENFMYSYNITSIDSKIKKAINRERTNVGRSAYSDRIKSIIKSIMSERLVKAFCKEIGQYSSGDMHDELKWIDVQEYVVKQLNSISNVVFITPEEMMSNPNSINRVSDNGYEIITITDQLKSKIIGKSDINGNVIRDLNEFTEQYNESFEFKFVDPNKLNKSERAIFNQTRAILNQIGGKPNIVKHIKISETMRAELYSSNETLGIWDLASQTIIVRRDQLKSLESYSGVLLHEVAHATSVASDLSIKFENELTYYLGKLASRSIRNGSRKSIFSIFDK